MGSRPKRQGVISGSIDWNGKEYVEIFDRDYKYLYGEVDDLFIAYGSWVEYDVVDAPQNHPKNCLKRAINIDMDMKTSNAPTTDEFGDKPMNVRDFNKVDYFQFNLQGDGSLTHKSTIRRNYTNDSYYNGYYGEVLIARDARNRLINFNINELDVMMSFISSTKYSGSGPHWEVTHFVNQGTPYSINGYLSIRGFILRGPGGIVRNRRDVRIPPDALRPRHQRQSGRPQWGDPIRTMPAPTEEEAPIGEKPIHKEERIESKGGMKPRNLEIFGAEESMKILEDKLKTISMHQRSRVAQKDPIENSIKPRGLSDYASTVTRVRSFGGEKPSKVSESAMDPVQLANGNRLVKLNESVKDAPRFSDRSFGGISMSPVVTVEGKDSIIRQQGFVFTPEVVKPPGSTKPKFSFGRQNPPAPIGSGGGGKKVQKHPLDDSFDEKKESRKVGDLYDDDWGDNLPRFIPRREISRSRLPPQVKKGLSKYGQNHF